MKIPRTALLILIGLLPLHANAGPVVANPSFESPDVSGETNGFRYNPSLASQGGSGWTFTFNSSTGFGSGIAHNGSGFGNSVAPDGVQVAILQGDSTFSQSVTFTLGLYTVSFFDSLRDSGGANPFQVTLDGTPLTFNGGTTITPGSFPTFEFRTSDPFTASAGAHTLAFVGHPDVPGADRTAFIDQVQVNVVPEPTTIVLLAVGVAAIALRRRAR